MMDRYAGHRHDVGPDVAAAHGTAPRQAGFLAGHRHEPEIAHRRTDRARIAVDDGRPQPVAVRGKCVTETDDAGSNDHAVEMAERHHGVARRRSNERTTSIGAALTQDVTDRTSSSLRETIMQELDSARPCSSPHDRSEGDVNLGAARAGWMADHIDAATRDLLAEDAELFLHQALSTPCLDVIERAEGIWLIDTAGRRIMDFHGNTVHQVGHGHPRVVAAITAQMATLPFCPRRYTNRAAIDLARRLTDLAPGPLSRVLFAPGGTSAIGMALKLARYATGRHKTISMWDAFHGASLDAISVGGEAIFRRDAGPLLPGTEHVPPPALARRFFGDDDGATDRLADYIEYVLEVQGDVGAVIAEPMRWTTVEPPPPGFWPRVRAACDRHGALLIFDEIRAVSAVAARCS